MKTGDDRSKQAADLRRQAEEIAREKTFQIPENMESLSIEAARQMFHELRVHQIELEMQNEELRQAQAELVAARARYFDLYDLAPVGYFTLSETGLILEVNLTAVTLLGVTRSALAKQPLSNFIIKEDQDVFYRLRKQTLEAASALEKGAVVEAMTCNLRMARNGGMFFWGHITMTVASNVGGANVCRVVLLDLTEHKHAEEELAKVAREWQTTFDATNDAIWILDEDQRVLRSNKTAEEFFHQPFGEMVGKHCWEIVHSTKQPIPECPILRVRQSLRRETTELQMGVRWFEVNVDPILDEAGLYSGAVHIVSDITDRKRAEFELSESEKCYRMLFDSIDEGFCIVEVIFDEKEKPIDYRFLETNPSFVKQTGLIGAQGKRMRELAPKHEEHWFEIYGEIAVTGQPVRFMNRAEQLHRWYDVYAFRVGDPENRQVAILFNDITDRKQVVEALKESESKYRLLADNVNDVIFVLDMNLNYTYVSPSIEILRGYEPEEVLKSPSIETLTPSSWDLAVRTLSEVMDLEKSEHREINISRTLELEMIRKDETTVWTEVKFSFIRDKDQRPVGILGLTRDITERKRAEEQLQRTIGSLRKAIGSTIQVMVSAVEIRDPYTAGHQLRVAGLASAIATEIGLPQDRIDGIRMAGPIHDIGKLSVPVEILSKPKKLTEIEFSLIKEHSQKGYEMLKDVDSPWPLAQIVYQHHERMDGSGYPRNLKGDEILMEARIMAIADVVESMASHRPYRPALGLNAALEEIEINKGTLYDADVVDACLRLFREKGFQLESIADNQ
jgi:PAS domain S-box-containing protein